MILESAFLLEVRGWRHNACLSSECSLDMCQVSPNARKGIKKLGKDNLLRILPPISVPNPRGEPLRLIRAPSPPDEPPLERLRFVGFQV